MHKGDSFFNLYNHNFVRVAVGIPQVRVADPGFNAERTIELMYQATEKKAILVLFPELGVSAYTCDDLFHQQALLDACCAGLEEIIHASRSVPLITVVGMPLRVDHALYNCAVVMYRGGILGVVPKTYLPNHREFYELRQFSSGEAALPERVLLCGQRNVPFGSRLLFQVIEQPLLRFHVEICEDLWVPIPPSCYGALAGATLLLNLSASNITIGKDAYRHQLVSNQSARCLAAYLYSAAGTGESTTDLAWDGHALIYENGQLVAESPRFSYQPQLAIGDVDLERLTQERLRTTSFAQSVGMYRETLKAFRTVQFSAQLPRPGHLLLQRLYERYPYVPADPHARDIRCHEAYEIQVQGLVKRLQTTGIEHVVIGISGGLDSTQALIVCARAMDLLGFPRTHILGYTMPGFATSQRTLEQAHRLMEAIGCHAEEIDIRPSCMQLLKDIGHPYREDQPFYDVSFENVQAGERTHHLFRLANLHDALVIGTGDLSELALGWCTYGVGDQMSHYAVNASVPKTLIQYLIRWVAETEQLGRHTSEVLYQVLATDISPELVPGEDHEARPAQKTEALIGPYELQDFNLYYLLRFGFSPIKVAFLAYCAWHDKDRGHWPDIPAEQRNQYSIGEIKQILQIFAYRFFKFSQFKRSCIPNAPKVGSGGSLSPRGDYRAPSDSEATAWLQQVKLIPDSDEVET